MYQRFLQKSDRPNDSTKKIIIFADAIPVVTMKWKCGGLIVFRNTNRVLNVTAQNSDEINKNSAQMRALEKSTGDASIGRKVFT